MPNEARCNWFAGKNPRALAHRFPSNLPKNTYISDKNDQQQELPSR